MDIYNQQAFIMSVWYEEQCQSLCREYYVASDKWEGKAVENCIHLKGSGSW